MIKRIVAKRDQQGFTLIEMLVVIVILGILAAIVVFAVSGLGDRGQGAACDTDFNTLVTAEEANFAMNGAYTTEANLVANGLLARQSTLHDITLGGGGTSYTVTAVAGGPCV
ncbi:MAG: prepilin-type N-terminal cleavage/methylation domain-containing protein [Actinomycetota bacterium]